MKVFAALLLASAIQADIAQDTQGVEKRSLHTRNSQTYTRACDVLVLQSLADEARVNAQKAYDWGNRHGCFGVNGVPFRITGIAATSSQKALAAQGLANACIDAKNKADQSALDQQPVKDAADCAAYDARVIAEETAAAAAAAAAAAQADANAQSLADEQASAQADANAQSLADEQASAQAELKQSEDKDNAKGGSTH